MTSAWRSGESLEDEGGRGYDHLGQGEPRQVQRSMKSLKEMKEGIWMQGQDTL